MNKTAIKVLQELIRSKDFSIVQTAKKLNKANSTIYDCMAVLRKNSLLDKHNNLKKNLLSNAYKKLFLSYPFDFSFLTSTNLKILFLLDQEISFKDLVKKTKLSRYTVNHLLKELKNRGFINKKNKLIHPPELIDLIHIIKKYQKTTILDLPKTAVIIDDNEERSLIQATKDTNLPLKKTAFSAFNVPIISPHNYYTTKKRVSLQDIFNDAKCIAKTRREQLITAMFYKKNRNKLKKDKEYEDIIQSKEFKDMLKTKTKKEVMDHFELTEKEWNELKL